MNMISGSYLRFDGLRSQKFRNKLKVSSLHFIGPYFPYHLRQITSALFHFSCRFEGDDVVWIKQRNCSTTGYVRGSTKESTLRKLKRLTCDELRLCGHHNSSIGGGSESPPPGSPVGSRRNSFGDGEMPSFHVAVNPVFFTTILESSWRTLTRVYVFRCSLFRFTEKDIAALANVENLMTLSICRVSDANAVNDSSLLPVINRGTLEKLVLDRMTVTDRSLIALGEKCKKISLLSVWGCSDVTERGVGAVAETSLADGAKVICRQTQFDCTRFLRDSPRFSLSISGRALELPEKKISIHFV